MAAQVGVSFSAMQIRLRELDLLEYHPLDEYAERNILMESRAHRDRELPAHRARDGGKADERLYQ